MKTVSLLSAATAGHLRPPEPPIVLPMPEHGAHHPLLQKSLSANVKWFRVDLRLRLSRAARHPRWEAPPRGDQRAPAWRPALRIGRRGGRRSSPGGHGESGAPCVDRTGFRSVGGPFSAVSLPGTQLISRLIMIYKITLLITNNTDKLQS